MFLKVFGFALFIHWKNWHQVHILLNSHTIECNLH